MCSKVRAENSSPRHQLTHLIMLLQEQQQRNKNTQSRNIVWMNSWLIGLQAGWLAD